MAKGGGNRRPSFGNQGRCIHGKRFSKCDECTRKEKEEQEKNLAVRMAEHRAHVEREKRYEKFNKEWQEEALKDPFNVYHRDVVRAPPEPKVKGKLVANDCALCRTPIYANQETHYGVRRETYGPSYWESSGHTEIQREIYHRECCEECAHCFGRPRKNRMSREYRICTACKKHICLSCSPVTCIAQTIQNKK